VLAMPACDSDRPSQGIMWLGFKTAIGPRVGKGEKDDGNNGGEDAVYALEHI
jgi:hypothetical protein